MNEKQTKCTFCMMRKHIRCAVQFLHSYLNETEKTFNSSLKKEKKRNKGYNYSYINKENERQLMNILAKLAFVTIVGGPSQF